MYLIINLPESAEEYFKLYHERAYSIAELISLEDFKNILSELKKAHNKYQERRKRIRSIGGWIESAIKNYEKITKRTKDVLRKEADILEALF